MQITLQVDFLPALPVLPYQPGQDCHVGAEEGEALQPDEEEGVVSLELKQVCWQEPRSLIKAILYYEKGFVQPARNPRGGLQKLAA